ncbi:hypothetical protein TREPR_2350 [Treponema primitia ZAS-2]|uniref:Uncharacterized protein n=1 Tax=Treponema primitia (strain ATCC BAA-887 / DSM 12427 / ZAS-2) TaxID=545694 RepID=F5YHV6_TREPZ|nr:hypothetical protein [Treponema primitia]AEF84141.1 hypothetical protein TREPR_2350 [Treponema primitia ZAS-2]
MDEDTPKQGQEPGAGDDQELVFYYNRERRLEKASAAVRALNEPGPPVKGGLIRSLTSTKPHAFLFISILLIMAMLMVFSALNKPQELLTLEDNELQFGAGHLGDEPYMAVRKRIAKDGNPYTGEVYIGVSPVIKGASKLEAADIPVFTHRIFFTLEQEEEYRFALPFDAAAYVLLIQVGDHRASTRVKSLSN